MLVEQAGDHVGIVVAPQQLRAQRLNVLLNALEHWAQAEFWVVQKAQQKLHLAVARAAAQTSKTRVRAIGPQYHGFNGIGKGQLPIVVGVDPNLDRSPLAVFEKHVAQRADLLAVERAKAIDHVHSPHVRMHQHLQRALNLGLRYGGNGH